MLRIYGILAFGTHLSLNSDQPNLSWCCLALMMHTAPLSEKLISRATESCLQRAKFVWPLQEFIIGQYPVNSNKRL